MAATFENIVSIDYFKEEEEEGVGEAVCFSPRIFKAMWLWWIEISQ